MFRFRYQAMNAKGELQEGSMQAQTAAQVTSLLSDQGLSVLSLKKSLDLFSKTGLNQDQKIAFTIQLEQLLSSGIALYDSLNILMEGSKDLSYYPVIESLANDIKNGLSFSEALKRYPNYFDHLYISLVIAGESIGDLSSALKQIIALLTERRRVKKMVINALTYPAILISMSLVLVVLLLAFVVPSMAQIFEGRQLNQWTQLVLSTSNFMANYWLYILITAIGIPLIGWYYLQDPEVSKRVWTKALSVPYLGPLLTQLALIRFCKTISALLGGGVSLTEGLLLTQQVLEHDPLEKAVAKAHKDLTQGHALSHSLSDCSWVPSMMLRMIEVGESTGALETMFSKISDLYEEDVDKQLYRITVLLQPIILIILGLFIGMILFAVLIPMTDTSGLAF